ncbi:DUF6271 family protein [Actinocrispum wychmicini]|uniref:Uncharacterized protein n=1 Tax=Actinocrispum wychmicini TaxID=1213861 RepID=A0A4R2IQA1_9PSEU|nr:DUF6271 family protein [Actinocrispum wychmicini]TCO47354.1 hypothetical protein EV192_11794 [Actinocrispum wychmicini]
MREICLTLPTNRACATAIAAIAEEAAYAVEHFDVRVYVVVLDSSDEATFAEHAKVIDATSATPNVIVLHLDEADQRQFLRNVIRSAEVAKPDLVLDLMLPEALSYGACTNRAFLIASALGCDSVHRRDSDSDYQELNGRKVFPIHHELAAIGLRAADVAVNVTESLLDSDQLARTVAMVAGSFIGELSVDIDEIRQHAPDVYYDFVSLWAPGDSTDAQKQELVAESFTGAGTEPFTHDRSVLSIVDPMRVDMCNISFHQVHEDVPLPPATDTIGSDYFLIHVVHDAALPGVLHNRHIVNFHTPDRKTGPGFMAYQLRYTKFVLSMLYLHYVYTKMAEGSLLDERGRVRASVIAEFVRESTWLGKDENVRRLDSLDRAYRKLGGGYTEFADTLVPRREQLLAEAQRDMEDFALLIDVWDQLVRASKITAVPRAAR